MHKFVSLAMILTASIIAISGCYNIHKDVTTKPSRDHITCWQNHAVVDLPIIIPASYSEQTAEELRTIVCEEYFGFSPVVTPPSDL